MQSYQSAISLDVNSHFSDPKLTDTTSHNYAPLLSSPLINSGDPVYNSAICGTLDVTGGARLFGSRVDIGAYENRDAPTSVISPGNGNESGLMLFPNPTTGILHYTSIEPVISVIVKNILGQVMIADNHSQGSIDLGGLSEGIYFITIFNGEWTTAKVLKK